MGVSPNSPGRRGPVAVGLPIVCGGAAIASGDVMVGDRDGVVVVPRARLAETLANLTGQSGGSRDAGRVRGGLKRTSRRRARGGATSRRLTAEARAAFGRLETRRMIDFPIIDSHIHLLDQKRFGYAWASGAPALKRDWTPEDLAGAAKPYRDRGAGVRRSRRRHAAISRRSGLGRRPRQARPARARRRRLSAAGARGQNRAGDGAGRETQDGARRAPSHPEPARPGICVEAGLRRSGPAVAKIQSHLRHLHLPFANAEHARP